MKIFTKIILILFPVFIWTDGFAQWDRISTSLNVSSYTASGSNLYIGVSGKVYYSSNNGVNFYRVGNLSSSEVALGVNGSRIFAGTNSGGVGGFYYTTDGDTNWTQTYTGSTYNIISTASNYVYIISNYYIWRSTNNGLSFVQTSSPQYPSVLCANALGNIIYAGYPSNISNPAGGLYYSSNSGSSWVFLKVLDSLSITDIKTNGFNIYVTTNTNVSKSGSIWISTNSGANWTQKQLFSGTRVGYRTICVVNSDIFIGGDSGVVLSRDNGNTWIRKNEGFVNGVNTVITKMYFSNNYLFASNGSNLYRRLYTEAINVKKISTEISNQYRLNQNYPNPFNPSTTIRYQIPKEQFVNLNVFDITGKELETLVNERQSPGTYEVSWNAEKYSSGVYFYKIESEGYTDTKRMLLVK